MTELECMTDYSLVPVDSIVCSSGDNTTWTQWSSLYINEIQHLSSENIIITIPEEFSWDYTGDEENFVLTISWYNVDTDYIAWIIQNQTITPNNADLNNIISWIVPLFVPWLIVILFIYFVFKFVKKIF